MGLLQAAQGLSNVLFAPLMVVLLTYGGWRWAFWGPGIVGGVLLLVLIRFFANEPAERGLQPLGAAPGTPLPPVHRGASARVRTKVFLQHAKRTATFWNLIGIHYWGCAGHAIIIVYLADMIRSQGLSLATGALVLSTMYGVSSFTRFAVPILADRAGGKGAMALCFFLQGLPILVLFWAHALWHFYLFAVLIGIGLGGGDECLPDHQSPVLRPCPHGDRVWLADIWVRPGHGQWLLPGRVLAGSDGGLHPVALGLVDPEHGWGAVHPALAQHGTPPAAGMGNGAPSRGALHPSRALCSGARGLGLAPRTAADGRPGSSAVRCTRASAVAHGPSP